MRLWLAATPKAAPNPHRDWPVLKSADKQQVSVSKITRKANLNTCTYSELCKVVKDASESSPCLTRCKKRCPWCCRRYDDTVEEVKRELIEAKRRRHSQTSLVHAEVAVAKAAALSAAYNSEREKYYDAMMLELENACTQGKHSKTWHWHSWEEEKADQGSLRWHPWRTHSDLGDTLNEVAEPRDSYLCRTFLQSSGSIGHTLPNSFDEDEMSEAIQSLKSNKAPGLDGKYAEVFRILELWDVLLRVLTHILLGDDPPEMFPHTVLLPIYKKVILQTQPNI